MVQLTSDQPKGAGSKVRASAGGLSTLAASLLLPLAVACSGEAEVNADEGIDGEVEYETAPFLVDSFEPDPSMFFGESEEEQARARAVLGADALEGADIEKRVDTQNCLEFTVPPFMGPGAVFDNTLPAGGLTPQPPCGTGTGASRLVLIQNFSRITRPGSGGIALGVRNATVAECADLRVALAVAVDRGVNRSPKIEFSSKDIPAELKQVNGGAICASYIPMFGNGSLDPDRFDNNDLWVAVQATKNGQEINSRAHVIRQSELE